MALFANSPRCNRASAAEGRPSVPQLASSRQPVTHKRHWPHSPQLTPQARHRVFHSAEQIELLQTGPAP
jgi:hypothetical protein